MAHKEKAEVWSFTCTSLFCVSFQKFGEIKIVSAGCGNTLHEELQVLL